MKARIKSTGEIINIADYAKVTLDKCDSYGKPIELSFDEVEIIDEPTDKELEEQEHRLIIPYSDMPSKNRMRYELTMSALKSSLAIDGLPVNSYNHLLAERCVNIADEIIKQLNIESEVNND